MSLHGGWIKVCRNDPKSIIDALTNDMLLMRHSRKNALIRSRFTFRFSNPIITFDVHALYVVDTLPMARFGGSVVYTLYCLIIPNYIASKDYDDAADTEY
jgi:hypothetical protein